MTVVEEGQRRKSGRGMLCIGYDGLAMEGRLWRMNRVEKLKKWPGNVLDGSWLAFSGGMKGMSVGYGLEG